MVAVRTYVETSLWYIYHTCRVATENSEKSEIFGKYFHNRISKIMYVALTMNK